MRPSAYRSRSGFDGEQSLWFLPVITPIHRSPPSSFKGEPPLEDLLCDPILRRLIHSDGLSIGELLTVITDAQATLA